MDARRLQAVLDMQLGSLGIRREDKNEWERRAPLAPEHVARLVASGVEVRVQPSPQRVFDNRDYAAAGAIIDEHIASCDVLMGVKEFPITQLVPNKTHVFFSHTIKGQSENMQLLQGMLDRSLRLIDFERIVDERGSRLVAFGRHAGIAGALETLRALGRQLEACGAPSPLMHLRAPYQHETIAAAKLEAAAIGRRLQRPTTTPALVIGVAGAGRVARGVREVLELLAPQWITPGQLLDGAYDSEHELTVVEFTEQHTVRHKRGATFSLKSYLASPQDYESAFSQYLGKLDAFINAIYWTPDQPRLFTTSDLQQSFTNEQRPMVIGDITCDIDGSVPCTVRATTPASPTYRWDVRRNRATDDFGEQGPLLMTVDNLPCEFSADATLDFGNALLPFVRPLIAAQRFGEPLPNALAAAMVVDKGHLTAPFQYLTESLMRHGHTGDRQMGVQP